MSCGTTADTHSQDANVKKRFVPGLLSGVMNMFQLPDRITVKSERSLDLQATATELVVCVRGTSFFTGREAFKKAQELQKLVQALADAGVPEENIELRDVALTNDGKVLVTSSAAYTVRIRHVSVPHLSKVITAIAARKDVSLEELEWEYPLTEETKRKLLKEALEAAKTKADFIATTLGARIIGVYNLTDEFTEPIDTAYFGQEAKLSKSLRARRAEPIDFHFEHTGRFMVSVKAEFKISEFPSA